MLSLIGLSMNSIFQKDPIWKIHDTLWIFHYNFFFPLRLFPAAPNSIESGKLIVSPNWISRGRIFASSLPFPHIFGIAPPYSLSSFLTFTNTGLIAGIVFSNFQTRPYHLFTRSHSIVLSSSLCLLFLLKAHSSVNFDMHSHGGCYLVNFTTSKMIPLFLQISKWRGRLYSSIA